MNEAEATTDTKTRRVIKARTGVVVSAKSEKTVTVEVRRYVKHGKYKKYVVDRKRYKAHDEVGCGVGDLVRIHETRPTSKTKRWRVAERLAKDGTPLQA